MTTTIRRNRGPLLFLVAGALFGLGAVRDAFLPHFFSLRTGNPAASAGVAVVFLVIGAGQLRNQTPSEQAERFR
jgi:hypothetical protein